MTSAPSYLTFAVDSHIVDTVEVVDGRAFLDVDSCDRPVGLELLADLTPAEVALVIALLLDTLPR